ncbi:MAG TPA: hypothetical protein VG897_04340 [Terriglobales bacterium]|nr:hypothetical protein [Terriglobales bacterium]
MTSLNEIAPSEICERVKKLGYTTGNRIHMYGERFIVVSDPFPVENGIAIKVRAIDDTNIRIVSLPATVLQAVREKRK